MRGQAAGGGEIGGEGRKEGKDKRGGGRRCVIYLAKGNECSWNNRPTSRREWFFGLRSAPLLSGPSHKRQPGALGPGSGDKIGLWLARVVFVDVDDV